MLHLHVVVAVSLRTLLKTLHYTTGLQRSTARFSDPFFFQKALSEPFFENCSTAFHCFGSQYATHKCQLYLKCHQPNLLTSVSNGMCTQLHLVALSGMQKSKYSLSSLKCYTITFFVLENPTFSSSRSNFWCWERSSPVLTHFPLPQFQLSIESCHLFC